MAYLEQDDKLQDPNAQPNQNQGQQQLGGGGGSAVTGGQGAGVAGNVSTAGIGAGGTNRWTNIQAYLGANQNNAGSANAINQEIGSQFDKEKQDVEKETSGLKSQAQEVAGKVGDVQKNIGDYYQKAANNYQWGDQQNDGYSQNVNKIKGAMSAQYTAPKEYARGISSDSQKYGEVLGNDNAFNQYMGDMYQKRSGGQLSSGGRELQKQLDINNESLNQARGGLQSKFSGLQEYLGSKNKETNDVLHDSEEKVRVGKNAINDFFSAKPESVDQSINLAQAKAKDDYNKLYSTGLTGLSSANADAERYQAMNGWGQNNDASYLNALGADMGAENLTWENLAKDQDQGKDQLERWGARGDTLAHRNEQLSTNRKALDNFINQQDSKYFDTADTQKREYNTLKDLLGLGGASKTRGFQVRA